MSYPEYRNDLYEIYKSEVTGETLFSTIAALTFSIKKEKWSTLASLETQTKSRYLAFVQDSDERPRFPFGAKVMGYVFGVIFALLPWPTAMRALKSGTPALIKTFSRLRDNSEEEDRDFFDYVLQHEVAISEFARLEIEGSDNSMAAINRLLGE